MRVTALAAALVTASVLMFTLSGSARAAGPGTPLPTRVLTPPPARRPLVMTFNPMDFRVKQPERSYTQNSNMLFANFRDSTAQGGVTFAARLRLPAKARITALTLIYSTLGSPNPLYNGELLRLRPGGNPEQILSIGGSNITRGAITQVTSSTPITSDPRDLIVSPASEYAVEVYSHNVSTRIHGLKVAYVEP